MEDNTHNQAGQSQPGQDTSDQDASRMAEPQTFPDRSAAGQLWYEARVCIGFLTRLPVFAQEYAGGTSLAAASWAFPVAGLAVGILGAVALWIADGIGLASGLAALIAIAAMVAVTGALHEDGLADTADGFGLTGDAARRLAAMHDSHIGVFGMVALIVVFGARWSALADLLAPSLAGAAEALVAAATISRGVLPYVMHAVPNARSDGLSVAAGRPESRPALIALAISAVVALLAFGFGGAIVVLAVAALVAYGIVFLARRLIGGQTGDVLGAIQQLVETAVLVSAAALAS
jgi:adenosylcobinamide-GDP ribazoletransferase